MAYFSYPHEDLPASGIDNAIWAVEKRARETEERLRREKLLKDSELTQMRNAFERFKLASESGSRQLVEANKLIQNIVLNLFEFVNSGLASENFYGYFTKVELDELFSSYLKAPFVKKVDPEFHPERESAHFCGNAIRVECPVCKAHPKEKCSWEKNGDEYIHRNRENKIEAMLGMNFKTGIDLINHVTYY